VQKKIKIFHPSQQFSTLTVCIKTQKIASTNTSYYNQYLSCQGLLFAHLHQQATVKIMNKYSTEHYIKLLLLENTSDRDRTSSDVIGISCSMQHERKAQKLPSGGKVADEDDGCLDIPAVNV
jgi:hypothetical protein